MLRKGFRRGFCAICATVLLAGSLTACGGTGKNGTADGGSNAAANSAAAEEVSFPLAEKYEFSIMTRVASDSEQDFSKKAWYREWRRKQM